MNFIRSISDVKDNIDLCEVVRAFGVDLKPSGPGRYQANCPFHSEQTPSFFIFQEKRRFKCFGCGAGGDVFDFYTHQTGCTFKEAVKALAGQNAIQLRPPDPRREHAKQLVKKFREWERSYSEILCQWIGAANRLLFRACPNDLDRYADVIRLKAVCENHLQILAYSDDQEKHALFQAIKNGRGGDCYA
jgi:hypothetical protein